MKIEFKENEPIRENLIKGFATLKFKTIRWEQKIRQLNEIWLEKEKDWLKINFKENEPIKKITEGFTALIAQAIARENRKSRKSNQIWLKSREKLIV